MHKTAAILLAGGSSERFNGKDKVLAKLNGQLVIQYSLNTFNDVEAIDLIVLVFRDKEQLNVLKKCTESCTTKTIFIQGGEQRQDSVLNGLNALPNDIDFVHIHDCARPLISPEIVQELHNTTLQTNGAILVEPVVNTIKQSFPENPTDLYTPDRETLWAVQTPQAFKKTTIHTAYKYVNAEGIKITDDASAAEAYGIPVTMVENDQPNFKITREADLPMIEYYLKTHSNANTL